MSDVIKCPWCDHKHEAPKVDEAPKGPSRAAYCVSDAEKCQLCGWLSSYELVEGRGYVTKKVGGSLTFKCKPSDDEQLTCFFCVKQGVDVEFGYLGISEAKGLSHVTQGAHRRCVESHNKRQA